MVEHSNGGFVAYDFCWSGFSPCSNLGWWGGLKVQSRGFSNRKSLRCARLMVLWVFCSNLRCAGSCVWFSGFVLVCSGFDFLGLCLKFLGLVLVRIVGLVGFQLGDWCWLCEQRGCKSVDFDWCTLGSNFCVQFLGSISRFNFRYIDLLILVDYCLNWILNFNVFGCKENTRKIEKRKENKDYFAKKMKNMNSHVLGRRTWTCLPKY